MAANSASSSFLTSTPSISAPICGPRRRTFIVAILAPEQRLNCSSNASLCQQRFGARQLRTFAVRLLAERGELSGVAPGLRTVARELGGSRRAREPTEAVRLDAHRRLELLERLHGLVGLEQHLGQELTRRGQRARRHRVLLRRVLALGGRAAQGHGFVVPALGSRHPGLRDLAPDVDLLRPVPDLGRRQRVAQHSETIGIPPRGNSVAAARGSERDRKSTRLNSSHTVISYAVFCLKKKTR